MTVRWSIGCACRAIGRLKRVQCVLSSRKSDDDLAQVGAFLEDNGNPKKITRAKTLLDDQFDLSEFRSRACSGHLYA
jgi:hypothetical protein